MYLRFAPKGHYILGLCLVFLLGLLPPLIPVQAATGLIWDASGFHEDVANDGSLDSYIEVELDQDGSTTTFVQSDDLVADHLVTVNNLPAGLTCRIEVIDDLNCEIYIDGNADAHQAADSINNLTIIFKTSAFENPGGGMANGSKFDLSITFDDNSAPVDTSDGEVIWPGEGFTEAASDDGSIGNTLAVNVRMDESGSLGFEQCDEMVADGLAVVTNLPAGLNCSIIVADRGHCTISLTGMANNHTAADSISNLGIRFLDGAFTNGDATRILNSTRADIPVTFIDSEEPPIVEPPAGEPDITATFSIGSVVYYVNGVPSNMDATPYVEGGRTFVPVRYLAYCMGMTENNVAWDGNTQTASITENGFVVQLTMGSSWINVNGSSSLMDATPQIQGQRILLPARFVVEAFGGQVEWQPDVGSGTVVVTRNL